MGLLFSSPIPIILFFLVAAIVGVFIFELKARKKAEKPPVPPLPPTSIPLPKKPIAKKRHKKKILLIASGVLLLLLISLSVGLLLFKQRQEVIERAVEVEPTIGAPITLVATATPSLPSLSPIPIAVSSPTPAAIPPSCLELTASPLSGTTPLTVTFEARARDNDGSITSFLFNYGDETTQRIDKTFEANQEAVQTSEHVYTQPGSYKATITVLDDDVLFSAKSIKCEVTIEVLSASGETSFSETVGIGGTLEPSPTPTTTIDSQAESSPTVTPTATITQSPAPTAEQLDPEVPETGHGLPTIAIILSGLLLLMMSFAILL